MSKVLTINDITDSYNNICTNRILSIDPGSATDGYHGEYSYYMYLTGPTTITNFDKCLAYNTNITGPSLYYPLYNYSVFGSNAKVSVALQNLIDNDSISTNEVLTDSLQEDMFIRDRVDEYASYDFKNLIKIVDPNFHDDWGGQVIENNIDLTGTWNCGIPYDLTNASFYNSIFYNGFRKIFPNTGVGYTSYKNFGNFIFPGYNDLPTYFPDYNDPPTYNSNNTGYGIKYKIKIIVIYKDTSTSNSYTINTTGHLCKKSGDDGVNNCIDIDAYRNYKDWELYGYPEEHLYSLIMVMRSLDNSSYWGIIAGDELGTSFFAQPMTDSNGTFSGNAQYTIFCYVDGVMIQPNYLKNNNDISNKNYVIFPLPLNLRNLNISLKNRYPLKIFFTRPYGSTGTGTNISNGYDFNTSTTYATIHTNNVEKIVKYTFGDSAFNDLPTNITITNVSCKINAYVDNNTSWNQRRIYIGNTSIGNTSTVQRLKYIDVTNTSNTTYSINLDINSNDYSWLTRNSLKNFYIEIIAQTTRQTITRNLYFYGATLCIEYEYTSNDNKKSPFDIDTLLSNDSSSYYEQQSLDTVVLSEIPNGWTNMPPDSQTAPDVAYISKVNDHNSYNSYNSYDNKILYYDTNVLLNPICIIPIGPNYVPNYGTKDNV